jgi:hypothetical protein
MIDGSQDKGVDDRTTPLKGLRRDWTIEKEAHRRRIWFTARLPFLILLIATAVTMDAEAYGVSIWRSHPREQLRLRRISFD